MMGSKSGPREHARVTLLTFTRRISAHKLGPSMLSRPLLHPCPTLAPAPQTRRALSSTTRQNNPVASSPAGQTSLPRILKRMTTTTPFPSPRSRNSLPSASSSSSGTPSPLLVCPRSYHSFASFSTSFETTINLFSLIPAAAAGAAQVGNNTFSALLHI